MFVLVIPGFPKARVLVMQHFWLMRVAVGYSISQIPKFCQSDDGWPYRCAYRHLYPTIFLSLHFWSGSPWYPQVSGWVSLRLLHLAYSWSLKHSSRISQESITSNCTSFQGNTYHASELLSAQTVELSQASSGVFLHSGVQTLRNLRGLMSKHTGPSCPLRVECRWSRLACL